MEAELQWGNQGREGAACSSAAPAGLGFSSPTRLSSPHVTAVARSCKGKAAVGAGRDPSCCTRSRTGACPQPLPATKGEFRPWGVISGDKGERRELPEGTQGVPSSLQLWHLSSQGTSSSPSHPFDPPRLQTRSTPHPPPSAGSPPRAHLGLESGAGATPQQAGGRGAGELSACWTPELHTGLKAS